MKGSDLSRLFWVLPFLLISMLFLAPARAAQELIVSAAASLTHAFKEMAPEFEKTHTDLKIIFNFHASGPLLQQIEQGAPVDVFATADQETLDQAQSRRLINAATRTDFTANRLVLVVPGDSALPVRKPADLLQPAVKRIALGKPETVPVGRYAQGVLTADRLWEPLLPKFIYADNVRQVIDYVARGEVEAGFVYVTDAAVARDKVKTVAELATQKPIRYPIAVVAASKQPKLAGEFLSFVLSPEGQAILAKFGFAKP